VHVLSNTTFDLNVLVNVDINMNKCCRCTVLFFILSDVMLINEILL